MKRSTQQMLKILYVLAWIVFVGLSIEAGGFITGSVFAIINPQMVKNLYIWNTVELSTLYAFSNLHYSMLTLLMSFVAVLKAVLFYRIIQILHNKEVTISQPFSNIAGRFIFRMSYLALLIGLLCWCGDNYAEWFIGQGVTMPDIRALGFGGADVWLFMGSTLYVIAHVFKRGIEIQAENELTV